jgi:hypothetical protein
MGEYAKFAGKDIKIGTCEDMYYLRFDQRGYITATNGSVNPNSAKDQAVIRFRFPWPDEDKSLPGGNGPEFDPFRTLRIDDVKSPEDADHSSIQFSARNGYLVSLPCPEGTKQIDGLVIHKNGYGGAVHLFQNAVRSGKLVPVFQCGACQTMWRIEEESELEPYVKSMEARIERETGSSKTFYATVLERMKIKQL